MLHKIEFFHPTLNLGHERYIVFRNETTQAYLIEFLPDKLKISKFAAPLFGMGLSTHDANNYLYELLPEGYSFPEFVLDLAASNEEDLIGEEILR